MILGALLGAALAADPDATTLHGDLKAFAFASFPYDHPLLPDDPFATGLVDGRLKLEMTAGVVRLELHHSVTATTGGSASLLGPSSGVGTSVPEAVPLSWESVDARSMTLRGRTDRFSLSADFGPTRLTVGRQPISFGYGVMFTPLDLVGPFNPAVVDQEYKPGYDAFRFDAFWGVSGRATAVVAYAGGWDVEQMVAVGYGQHTVGVTDLGLFVGEVLSDEVLGATLSTSVGPVGLYGDAALTFPEDDDAFFRGSVGALWRPTGTTTLTGEVYLQTLGAAEPSEYFSFAADPRFARGELWLLGRFYAGLALSQEITPLLFGSLALIGNLEDPSALLSATLAWSVAGNAEVAGGAFFGIGQRPEGLEVRSEFGLYPITAFVETKAYF